MAELTKHDESVMVGPLRYVNPWWKRILLFQSLDQLVSYLLVLGIVFLGISFLFRIFFGEQSLGPYMGACLGALSVVWLVQPCSFFVRRNLNSGMINAVIEDRIRKYGYVVEEEFMNDSGAIYRHKLPRWLTWKENDVCVWRDLTTINVRGPRYVVRLIYKAVVNRSLR